MPSKPMTDIRVNSQDQPPTAATPGHADAVGPDEGNSNGSRSAELTEATSGQATGTDVSSRDGAISSQRGQLSSTADALTRRLADDSLFATTMERFASLFTQNDRGKLRTLLKRAYRDFCDLCPDGVSEVEILAAERVAIARMKVYVFDLLSLTPAAWRDPNEFMERKQRQAANELERAMKTYMTLRKVAESQPGFRMTVAQSESISPAGTTTRNRSVSVESVPHDLPAG